MDLILFFFNSLVLLNLTSYSKIYVFCLFLKHLYSFLTCFAYWEGWWDAGAVKGRRKSTIRDRTKMYNWLDTGSVTLSLFCTKMQNKSLGYVFRYQSKSYIIKLAKILWWFKKKKSFRDWNFSWTFLNFLNWTNIKFTIVSF